MGQFKKANFIINPFSGHKKFPALHKAIESYCGQNNTECNIVTTQQAGHATQLAKKSVAQGFDIVFAVGGDGTVNEVAKGLVHSSVTMGILPKGSGNGLARHLGIPQHPEKALRLLESGKNILMDTLIVNDEISVNVSGIGFDGHIANLFGKSGKRGLREYVMLSATEFRKFMNFSIQGTIDNQSYSNESFILAFANSSQFGNNATISPLASVCDGQMDICVIRKVSLMHALGFAGKMFTGRLHKSAFVKIINAKQAVFSFPAPMPYHIDGEGKGCSSDFEVKIIPLSLHVLAQNDKI